MSEEKKTPKQEETKNFPKPKLWQALLVMALTIAIMAYVIFTVDEVHGPMFVGVCIAAIMALVIGFKWKDLEKMMLDGIFKALQSILILAIVGILVGVWIDGGIVPSMIYYGLKLVSPKIFLPATMLLCSILSVCTGTSYGSAASAGLACMGIGLSMGFPAGVVAGAVICGALFGDKMSPFSDTTNLSSAMAGASLFGHIKSMFWTTIPSWLISLVIFAIIGNRYSISNYDPTTIEEYLGGLSANFNLSFLTLIPVILVIVMLLLKVPAFPTIMIGAVIGGLTAMITQGSSFKDVMTAMLSGYTIDSGILLVDKLLNRGGIASMYSILCIMIFAMGMGGMLDKMGVLQNFLGLFVKRIRKVPGLIISTMIVSYISSAIGCTQSMSHVLTGKLMNPIYKEKGVAPEVLSRTMEDCGTLGGALMPWHTNAIYFCGALSVTYAEYIPYLFLSFLAPLFAILFAFTGIAIWYVNENGDRIPKEQAAINK